MTVSIGAGSVVRTGPGSELSAALQALEML